MDSHNADLFHNDSTPRKAPRTIINQVGEALVATNSNTNKTITDTTKVEAMRLSSNKATIKDISNSNRRED